MKKVVFICCAVAAMFMAASCDEKPQEGYQGTNYIYLSSESNSMYDTADSELAVAVELTASLEEDLTLTFKTNDTENIISLSGNPAIVKAGTKTAVFTIKTAPINQSSQNFKVTLDTEKTVLPEKVVWREDFSFTVNSSKVAELTDAQKAVVEAYHKASGIYLPNYLGVVNVETVYTASSPDSDIPLEPVTITGKSTIELSEASTAEKPVLKMTVNPMGLHDVLYEKFLNITVKNTAMWFDEYSSPNYATLCEEIGWTATSEETFGMTLDNIKLAGTDVEFVADLSYFDEEYEEDVTMFKVPFEFSYTAYDRELKAIEEGKVGTAVDEYWSEDATANPAFHLNCDDISEDWYESGNYVEASASISAEKLEFTFCIYNYQDYDYSKVVATYTPNK